MKKIFIDADALVALARVRDKNHQKAKKIYKKVEKEKVSFISSNTSLYEAATVISQQINHQIAQNFILEARQRINFIFVDSKIEKNGLKIFDRQTSKNVSFFDCLNMAILKEMGAKEIFSFDEDYKKNGFLRLGIDTP
jgi:predicted nucleic acid-binding protein